MKTSNLLMKEVLIAKRDKTLRRKTLAEYKQVLDELNQLSQHWQDTAKKIRHYTHGKKYDLPVAIPHELALSITYWAAAVHMCSIPEELK